MTIQVEVGEAASLLALCDDIDLNIAALCRLARRQALATAKCRLALMGRMEDLQYAIALKRSYVGTPGQVRR